ncbi:MAG: hypothetical protein Q7T74_07500 [Candidatus Saccharibacteria bacterium]|nr:hypothetical protein [Candidatus Saccharibacteria bacterium]
MQPNSENGQNLWQPNQDVVQTPPTQSAPQATVEELQNSTFEPVSWEASESIHHEHDGMWFIGLIIVVLSLVGISVWMQQWSFTALIIIMTIALIIYIRRPPRVLRYNLSSNGLHIDQQFRGFDEFKSFGVLQEGNLFSIMLIPTKRFGQSLTIYFDEGAGERIVDILGAYLPMEDLRLDTMDVLLKRLRL